MKAKTSGKESGINRHFRWEAIIMAAMFVLPILWALVVSLIAPLVYSWLR